MRHEKQNGEAAGIAAAVELLTAAAELLTAGR